MWRSKRRPERAVDREHDGLGGSGAGLALDQVGQWVRFADTKATILAAGVGVVLSFLAASADRVAGAIADGGTGAWIVAGLGVTTTVALLVTLTYVVKAIRPQTQVSHHQLNRFAWPAVAEASVSDLVQRATTDPQADAWEQVHSLAQLAKKKYAACDVAVTWFAVLVAVGFLCVTSASLVETAEAQQDRRKHAVGRYGSSGPADEPPRYSAQWRLGADDLEGRSGSQGR